MTRKEPRRVTVTWANRRMAWIVMPLMETENPGGEAGLGYRGRTEVSVRRDEFET